jgi:hypothetical protein
MFLRAFQQALPLLLLWSAVSAERQAGFGSEAALTPETLPAHVRVPRSCCKGPESVKVRANKKAPAELGFSVFNFSGTLSNSWVAKVWRQGTLWQNGTGNVRVLGLQCWAACMQMHGCNYVSVVQQSEVECTFYSYCDEVSWNVDNLYVLKRENFSANIYIWDKLVQDGMKQFSANYQLPELAVGQEKVRRLNKKRDQIKDFGARFMPQSEDDYEAWLARLSKNTQTMKIGPSITYVPERPGFIMKTCLLACSAKERSMQASAREDLTWVLAELDSNGITRHHAVKPAIPKVDEELSNNATFVVERVYPVFATHLDPTNKLEPEYGTEDKDLSLGMAHALLTSAKDDVHWAWLKDLAHSDDPLRAIAYSKGVLDASLDCKSKLMHMRQPKPFLGRDFARKLWLFMAKFEGTEAFANFPWCNGSVVLSRSLSKTSAAFKPFPEVLESMSHDDYLDGYSDALAVIRGVPPMPHNGVSHSPPTGTVEARPAITTTLQSCAPTLGGLPEMLGALALLGTMLL